MYLCRAVQGSTDEIEQFVFDDGTVLTSASIDAELVAHAGTSGDDIIEGSSRIDTLTGGDGNDQLQGAGGADILEGGNGQDIFRFDTVSDSTINASDIIVDFDRNEDVIDLSALNATYSDLVVNETGGDTQVEIDGTDFALKLTGTGHGLDEDQFVF